MTTIRQKTIVLYISLLLVFSSSIFSQIVSGQEEQQTAEIALRIDDAEIPNIAKNWTAINLAVDDNFGLDWNAFKDLPKIFTHVLWRVMFGIPDIERYLGYTSILFEPDEDSVPEGWFVKIEPSTISETTANMSHKITMYAQVNELAAKYNPTIRIKCMRFDVLGDLYGITYATIPLKAVSLNYAFVNALESSKKAAPKTLVYFPIEVINQGEYLDTYNFEIKDNDRTYSLISHQALVLNPGEKKTVELGVLTPELFFDAGTPRRIDIIVYPVGSPSEKFETSVIVITEGFYISPLVGLILVPIIIFLIIIYFIFFHLKQKRERKIYGKPPVKPWILPEKKQYLKELIKKDEEEYKKEMKKLKYEYNSALVSYKQKRTEKKRKKKQKVESKERQKESKENKLTSFFKKSEKKEGKPIKEEEKKPERIKTEGQDIQQKPEEGQRKKKEVLLRIKREQEKQKRKIKK